MGALLDMALLVGARGKVDQETTHTERELLTDPAQEARRQRVLAMLDERPDTKYAVVVDNPDTDPVIVALGIRGQATCELRIPREKYDPILFLEAVERHSVP